MTDDKFLDEVLERFDIQQTVVIHTRADGATTVDGTPRTTRSNSKEAAK